MMQPDFFQLSLKEILALLGLTQSVYYLVYISFRVKKLQNFSLPVIFFAFLALAFLFSLAQRHWLPLISYYDLMEWGIWALILPLNVLMSLQILFISTKLPARFLWLLATMPVGFLIAHIAGYVMGNEGQWYALATIFIGVTVLSVMWRYRSKINGINRYKNGRERYWLIISFLFLTTGLISISFFNVNALMTQQEFDTIRVLLGLSFLYIAGTSLFRLYPYTVPTKNIANKEAQPLSVEEQEIAQKIENLLRFEKIYQEQSYNRSSLAKELNLPESVLSRIVNAHFNETIPQLFNRYRVNEAKLLLESGKIDITTISGDVGFNSIATFNRVFKELEGFSPSEYVEKTKKN